MTTSAVPTILTSHGFLSADMHSTAAVWYAATLFCEVMPLYTVAHITILCRLRATCGAIVGRDQPAAGVGAAGPSRAGRHPGAAAAVAQ
jgi:hypothetical protein